MRRVIARWLTWKMFAAIAAVLVLLPIVAIVASGSLREFVYKELSYRLITDRALRDEADAEHVALRLSEFIDENTYPGGGPALDTNAWNDLVRGIGWCDQVSWMLGTLLSTKNIPGRIVFLDGHTSDTGEAVGHVMAEVYLDGEWRLFDPLYGLVFRTSTGRLATLAELSADWHLVSSQPKVRALPPQARHQLEQFYEALFTSPTVRDPERWSSLLEVRRASRARAMVQTALDMSWRLFGAPGAYAFQDVYLGLLPSRLPALDASESGNRPVLKTRADDPALFLYYRARNYHLYERDDLASRAYEDLIARYLASGYAEKTSYFLGQVDLQLRRDPAAAVKRFAAFLDKYPQSSWLAVVHRALGAAYEALGDRDAANRQYLAASGDPYVGAAYRSALMSEESQPVDE